MQPMAANPLRVFVSHIHEEAALGAVIKGLIEDVFRGHGVVAFLSSDRQDLPAGRKWIEVIERELDQAKVVVSLLSPTSLRRPWVNIELGAAWIKHRHISPSATPISALVICLGRSAISTPLDSTKKTPLNGSSAESPTDLGWRTLDGLRLRKCWPNYGRQLLVSK